MDRIWAWIAGIAVSLLIIALVLYGSPGRQAYHRARGAIEGKPTTLHIQISPFDTERVR